MPPPAMERGALSDAGRRTASCVVAHRSRAAATLARLRVGTRKAKGRSGAKRTRGADRAAVSRVDPAADTTRQALPRPGVVVASLSAANEAGRAREPAAGTARRE